MKATVAVRLAFAVVVLSSAGRLSAQPTSVDSLLPSFWKLVSSVRYVEDEPRGTDDWKNVGRFFAEGGDCEDYATALMMLLGLCGFTSEEIVVGSAEDQYHMILRVDGRYLDPQRFGMYLHDVRVLGVHSVDDVITRLRANPRNGYDK